VRESVVVVVVAVAVVVVVVAGPGVVRQVVVKPAVVPKSGDPATTRPAAESWAPKRRRRPVAAKERWHEPVAIVVQCAGDD
jgi:hypothetical protein